MTINLDDYDQFHVTGKTTDGKRFRRTFSSIEGRWAFMINLWRGSVWGVKNGKRKLLKRVYN